MTILSLGDFVVRPFVAEDIDSFTSAVKDGDLFPEKNLSNDDCRALIHRLIKSYELLGFSKFAIVHVNTGKIFGYIGCELLHNIGGRNPLAKVNSFFIDDEIVKRYYPDCDKELEIGYRLHKDIRGKGIATMLCNMICNWFFERFNIERIIGVY